MKKWTPRQLVTDRTASLDFLQYLAGLERDIAAGGGGGGGASWGGITGTLSAQTDLQTALNGKAATVHTHAQSDVTGLVAALAGKADVAHVHALSDVTGLVAALAGIPVKGTATVTVPNNRLEWQETVTATGVVPADVVLLSIAPHDDADENDAEMLDVMASSALAGTNQITVTLAFATPTAGPIKLNWMAA